MGLKSIKIENEAFFLSHFCSCVSDDDDYAVQFCEHNVLPIDCSPDSIAVSVFVAILVEFDKY